MSDWKILIFNCCSHTSYFDKLHTPTSVMAFQSLYSRGAYLWNMFLFSKSASWILTDYLYGIHHSKCISVKHSIFSSGFVTIEYISNKWQYGLVKKSKSKHIPCLFFKYKMWYERTSSITTKYSTKFRTWKTREFLMLNIR